MSHKKPGLFPSVLGIMVLFCIFLFTGVAADSRMGMEETATATLTPTPSVTSQDTATATPTPTMVLVYLAVVIKPPRPTATPTSTATPTATATSTPMPTYTPTPPPILGWRGEYYDNPALSGAPLLVRDDPEIAFDWGGSAPAAALPVDGFSVRWTRTIFFAAGEHTFYTKTDDGVRLWVDGNLLIDEWHDMGPTILQAHLYLHAGPHDVRVEYYDRSGYATANLWWETSPEFPDWKGEYYSNDAFIGLPVAVRNDSKIEFDWGGGPAISGMPSDHFSVRWTRSMVFVRGGYRFHTQTDDGVRLWIDGRLVIDQWHGQDNVEWIADIPLESGLHFVRMEYYDNIGLAKAKFWWERIDHQPRWKGEYYANPTLSGSPVLVRDDEAINFDWGDGSPAGNVPSDSFSVRWTRNLTFPAGNLRFHVYASDGVRLWVDNVLIIDQWRDGPALTHDAVIYLPQGQHALHLEYYNHLGPAVVRLWWQQDITFPEWKGEYFANMKLEGDPIFVRNDRIINFNWDSGSPGQGLDRDHFSIRWTRQYDFILSGDYTFIAATDDGVRLWVDGQLVLDKWQSQPETTYQVTLRLARGLHEIRMEYYEDEGGAIARLRWEMGQPSADTIIDDGDPGFVRGGTPARWQETTGAGYNGHMYWTLNRQSTPENWASWTPNLARPGFYEIYVFVPAQLADATSVRYYIYYDGNRWARKDVNQSLFFDQWISLGVWRFKATNTEFVYLTDATTKPSGAERIAFDALKFVFRGP